MGRNFAEALGKAMRSTETKVAGFWTGPAPTTGRPRSCSRRCGRRSTAGSTSPSRRWPPARPSSRSPSASGFDPWFVDQIALVREIGAEVRDAPSLTPELLRRAKRYGLSDRQIAALRPELAGEDGVRTLRWRLGHPAGLQDRRHLRRRVRRPHAVPLLLLRRGERGAAAGEAGGADPRLRAQPDRAGHRVRLLLRARRHGAAGRRLRGGDGQLQPRDRLHRLRHRRPALLRAAHLRGRPRGGRGRARGRPGRRGHLHARRADAAGPGAAAQGRRRPGARHLAGGDRRRRAPRRVLPGAAPTPACSPPSTARRRRSPRRGRSRPTIGYPVLVRPSYVLGGRGMEIVYDDATLEAYIAKATDVSPAHPVLVDRFLEDAVEIDVDALYDGTDLYLGGVMEHIEEAGIHSGDSACALPPITLGSADLLKIRAATEKLAARIGVRGLMNVQYAIKDDILYVHRGQPAGRRARCRSSPRRRRCSWPRPRPGSRWGSRSPTCAPAGVLPATGDGTDLPEDAPIAVKEAVLPFHRFRTVEGHGVDTVLGAGDEVHRRGHGPRRRVRDGVRQVAGRRLRLAAHRGHGLRLAGQPRQALGDLPDQAAGRPRVPRAGHGRAPRRCCAATGSTARWSASSATAPATCVERILAGDVDIVVNTPFGSPGNSGPRLDGYEIRTAAVAAGIPCITTVQGMAAAVQGIEALRRGDIGVRSLQEVHAALTGRARDRRRGHASSLTAPAPRAGAPAGAAGRRGGRPPPGQRLRRADAWPRRRSPSAPSRGSSSPSRSAGETSALLLRRSIAIAGAGDGVGHRRRRRRTGPARPGWPGCRPGDAVDVVGPLGRPFPLPAPGTPALLVGGGYGAAALVGLAERLRAAGHAGDRRRRRRVGRPAVLGRGAGPARRRGRRHHRRRQRRAPRAGSPLAVGELLPGAGRRLRLRADGDAAGGRRAGHRAPASRPTSRSRSRWPAGSASA